MAIINPWAGKLSGNVSMERLIGGFKRQLFVPFYHLVDDDPCPHIDSIYPVRNRQTFRRDLEFLLKHFKPVSLQDVLARWDGDRWRPFEQPSLHLTIDDGLRQTTQIMQEILLEFGVPATVFLNSAYHGNQGLMYRYKAALLLDAWNTAEGQLGAHAEVVELTGGNPEHEFLRISFEQREVLDEIAGHLQFSFEDFLANYKPYMEDADLKSWLDVGFSVGSHSHDHPWYQALSVEEQLSQTTKGADWLESKLKSLGHANHPAVFAFPFSDADLPASLFEKIQASGIQMTFGGSGLKEDIDFNMPRFPVEKTEESMDSILRNELAGYKVKGWIGRQKMKR